MKKKTFILVFLLLLAVNILFPLTVCAKDFAKEDSLSSKNIAVINADNGFLVYTKNATERISPASATKIMTALIALEHFEGRLQTTVTVPAAATRGLEGSAVLNLKAGEEIAVIDLIHAALIAGMNDAANTLAFAIGGTMADFVRMMNEKAQALGAENTLFVNPTGLDSAAYTTAADLAQIAFHAYENRLFMQIASKRAYQVAATNMHEAVTIYTRNPLLTPQSEYYYSYAEGMCAGYSENDGALVVTAVSYGTYPYICVAAGAPKTSGGTIGAYSDVRSLLAWASYNFAERKILDRSKILCEMPVRAGDGVSHVLVVPDQSVYAFLDVDADLSAITLHEDLYYKKLNAPVEKGEIVGSVMIVLDGDPIGSTSLIAKTSIRRSSLGGFFLFWENVLTSPIFLIAAAAALLFLIWHIIKKSPRFQKKKPINPKKQANNNHKSI